MLGLQLHPGILEVWCTRLGQEPMTKEGHEPSSLTPATHTHIHTSSLLCIHSMGMVQVTDEITPRDFKHCQRPCFTVLVGLTVTFTLLPSTHPQSSHRSELYILPRWNMLNVNSTHTHTHTCNTLRKRIETQDYTHFKVSSIYVCKVIDIGQHLVLSWGEVSVFAPCVR